ncbi:MAG: hypothetical protein HOL01_20460 [Planctomycetaceae bacterium]|nr:hypothetical protein [Planctomycetaceae bacterium]MBT6496913.1 hypothetical protein [Planctomycetaceae bacterium]
MTTSRLKFSGRVHPESKFHQLRAEAGPDHVIPPTWVPIPGVGEVAQYSPTVFGKSIAYDPPNNCEGNFMSAKFQPNNNCYAYGTNIASNSFPQPGRINGYLLPSNFTGADVVKGATMDGLRVAGNTIDDIGEHADAATSAGHYVGLMISAPDSSLDWPGDYHWCRCDVGAPYNSWSQKDGSDQVTNFDFAGNPIIYPSEANWTVNQGPTPQLNKDDMVVSYIFYTYMFVPNQGVNII